MKMMRVLVVGIMLFYAVASLANESGAKPALQWPSISTPETQIAFAGHPTEVYLVVDGLKGGQSVNVQLVGDVPPVMFSSFVVSKNLWSCKQSQRTTVCGQGRDVFFTSLSCDLREHSVASGKVILPLRVIFPQEAAGTMQDLVVGKQFVAIDVMTDETETDEACFLGPDGLYTCNF
jgi:hypothetical protein